MRETGRRKRRRMRRGEEGDEEEEGGEGGRKDTVEESSLKRGSERGVEEPTREREKY